MQPQRNRTFGQFNKDQYCIAYRKRTGWSPGQVRGFSSGTPVSSYLNDHIRQAIESDLNNIVITCFAIDVK